MISVLNVAISLLQLRAQGLQLGWTLLHCRHPNTGEMNPTQFTSSRLGCFFIKFHSVLAFLPENCCVTDMVWLLPSSTAELRKKISNHSLSLKALRDTQCSMNLSY